MLHFKASFYLYISFSTKTRDRYPGLLQSLFLVSCLYSLCHDQIACCLNCASATSSHDQVQTVALESYSYIRDTDHVLLSATPPRPKSGKRVQCALHPGRVAHQHWNPGIFFLILFSAHSDTLCLQLLLPRPCKWQHRLSLRVAFCHLPFRTLVLLSILIATSLRFSGPWTTASMTQMLTSRLPTGPALLCAIAFATKTAAWSRTGIGRPSARLLPSSLQMSWIPRHCRSLGSRPAMQEEVLQMSLLLGMECGSLGAWEDGPAPFPLCQVLEG